MVIRMITLPTCLLLRIPGMIINKSASLHRLLKSTFELGLVLPSSTELASVHSEEGTGAKLMTEGIILCLAGLRSHITPIDL